MNHKLKFFIVAFLIGIFLINATNFAFAQRFSINDRNTSDSNGSKTVNLLENREGRGLLIRHPKIRKSLGRLLKKTPGDRRINVVIQYSDFPDESRLKRFRDGKLLKRTFKFQPFIAVKLFPAEILALAREDSLINMIEPDYRMKILLDTSVEQIKADRQSIAQYTGKDIRVAVIDTGVSSSHEGLKNKIVASKDFTDDGTSEDLQGHGTHVSCIIGCKNAKYTGVATDASILNAKVLNKNGEGDGSDLMAAIEWAIENKADIINLSLGSAISQCDGKDSVSKLVETAVQKGVIVAVAAGNSGPLAGTLNTPGCAETPITVGAVTDYNRMAYFSSRGPTFDGRIKPDIVAPGVEITSASIDNGWITMSGTSQATPHIAGILARMKDAVPSLTPALAKKTLMDTAVSLGFDQNSQGKGLVDAEKAVLTLADETPEEESNPETDEDEEPQDLESKEGESETNEEETIPELPVLLDEEKETINNIAYCLDLAGLDKQKRDACFDQFINEQETVEHDKLTEEETSLENTIAGTMMNVDEELGETESTTHLKKILGNYLYTQNSLFTIKEDVLAFLNDLTSDAMSENEANLRITSLEQDAETEKPISLTDKYSRSMLDFKDVDNDAWFLYYVRDVRNRRCISGYKDANGNPTGNYGPANKLTVAEALKIGLECAGFTADTAEHEPSDADLQNHWASPYFAHAEDLHLSIINNLQDPNRAITRSEVVRLLLEIYNQSPKNSFKGVFSDVLATHPNALWIEHAFDNEIVSGDAFKTTFRPDDPINRAEITKVVRQAVEAF